MSKEPTHHVRVAELRLRIPRRDGSGHFELPRHMLHWTTTFRDSETGESYDLDYVLDELAKQGWDIHDLTKGRGVFRDPVARLPLPHGGQFSPGDPETRDA